MNIHLFSTSLGIAWDQNITKDAQTFLQSVPAYVSLCFASLHSASVWENLSCIENTVVV